MKHRQAGFVVFGLDYLLISAAIIAGIIVIDQGANDTVAAEQEVNPTTPIMANSKETTVE